MRTALIDDRGAVAELPDGAEQGNGGERGAAQPMQPGLPGDGAVGREGHGSHPACGSTQRLCVADGASSMMKASSFGVERRVPTMTTV